MKIKDSEIIIVDSNGSIQTGDSAVINSGDFPNRYIKSPLKVSGKQVYQTIDEDTGSVFGSKKGEITDTDKTKFEPITVAEDRYQKPTDNKSSIITPASAGISDRESSKIKSSSSNLLIDAKSSTEVEGGSINNSIIESGISGEFFTEGTGNSTTDDLMAVAGAATAAANSVLSAAESSLSLIATATGTSGTWGSIGSGDSDGNKLDEAISSLENKKNGSKGYKLISMNSNELVPYKSLTTLGEYSKKGDNANESISGLTGISGSIVNQLLSSSGLSDIVAESTNAGISNDSRTTEEIAAEGLATRATILKNKPGTTIKYASGNELSPMRRQTGDYLNIYDLRDKYDFIKKLGYIYIEPWYNNGNFKCDSIPFEFSPVISEGGTEAKYATEDLINRITDLRTYIGTGSSTLSVEATYLALANDDDEIDGKNFAIDSWQYYWNSSKIKQMELMYRSLVMPYLSGDYFVRPPLVEVIMGSNGSNDDDNATSSVKDLFTYPPSTYSDEISSTITDDNDTDTTYLNTTRSLKSSDGTSDISLRLKKYVVTNVTISNIDGTPYDVSSKFEYVKNINDAETKRQEAMYSRNTQGQHLKTSSSSLMSRRGFKVSLSLVETTKNLADIVPDYKSYYDAWNAYKENSASVESKAEGDEKTSVFNLFKYSNSVDQIQANLQTLNKAKDDALNNYETLINTASDLTSKVTEAKTASTDATVIETNISNYYDDMISENQATNIKKITDKVDSAKSYKAAYEKAEKERDSYKDQMNNIKDETTEEYKKIKSEYDSAVNSYETNYKEYKASIGYIKDYVETLSSTSTYTTYYAYANSKGFATTSLMKIKADESFAKKLIEGTYNINSDKSTSNILYVPVDLATTAASTASSTVTSLSKSLDKAKTAAAGAKSAASSTSEKANDAAAS